MKVQENFSYNELKEMAEFFAEDNTSMALRIEVIKDLCEASGVNWSEYDVKFLKYYAEEPDHIPADPWMFKRALCMDARGL